MLLQIFGVLGAIMLTSAILGTQDILLVIIFFVIFSIGYGDKMATTPEEYLEFVRDGLALLYTFWLLYVSAQRYILRNLSE